MIKAVLTVRWGVLDCLRTALSFSVLARPNIVFESIRNKPIEAVDNDELDLALLGFEVQTELLPEGGKD
jgi:hypothetical protein